jgi:hypothetical protein
MHTGILKFICIHNDILHVSTNHADIFREVKYKVLMYYRIQNEITEVAGHMTGRNM